MLPPTREHHFHYSPCLANVLPKWSHWHPFGTPLATKIAQNLPKKPLTNSSGNRCDFKCHLDQKGSQNDVKMTRVFLALGLFFAICDSLSPKMGPGSLQTLKNDKKTSKITKSNNNCSMPFGSFLCIVQAGGGSSRGSSRQSSRQKSLHSACFSSVVSQRSATISAVNSTCSCQGVEGCGDATPQASSI